ncbi:MAG: hypothetical protein ACE5IO_10705 [Thermoplasmata archaeon]
MSPTVTKVGEIGKVIELNDGSKWEIDDMHALKSSLWMFGDEIAIVRAKEASRSSILVNVRKVDCVLAKRSER